MRALLGVVLALGASVAHADTIKPPAGFTLDKQQSEALTAKLNQLGHFGMPMSTNAIANVDVFTSPAPGVVLTVTLVGAALTEQRDAAARATVDELHATSQRAAMIGTGIVEQGWQERVDAAGKQIEATLSWADTKERTTSTSRLLIVADAQQMIALTGECYAADDAVAKQIADCKAALATLDPGIAAAKRVDVALAPTGARPTPPEPPGGSANEPAKMTDATRTPLPPMTMPQEHRTTDRRPVYVGIALVVLAAVFWWNRHRRARREDD